MSKKDEICREKNLLKYGENEERTGSGKIFRETVPTRPGTEKGGNVIVT